MKYTGEYTKEISFPLGGIGSGCIGLDGAGRLTDWEIFNRPAKGSINGYSHIAVKAIQKNKITAAVLNGDMNKELTGRYALGRYTGEFFQGFGFGAYKQSMCGFPHFKNVEFCGEFPTATLHFADDAFPAKVTMLAFNPFIPLDAKNSSIPGAFFEIEFENTTNETVIYQAAFTVANPFSVSKNVSSKNDGMSAITMYNAGDTPDSTEYGDLTVATDCEKTYTQTYWYRGRWQDNVVSYWNEFSEKRELHDRIYENNGVKDHCTLAAEIEAAPGEKKKVSFVLSWNVPNNYNYWSAAEEAEAKAASWKNYYATVFESSKESAKYSLENWEYLRENTLKFRNTLYGSTLPKEVLDAAGSSLSVLKSPTVLRLEDGAFYGWEGVREQFGSCQGTCQHVWNYAYALCFLFPGLERSIRNNEFKYTTHDNGKMNFRMSLPYGAPRLDKHACVDGQMGAVIKCYREWKISGDNKWLADNWENIKKVLEYAWSPENIDGWDFDKDGVLEGRQHHTLDMELFGPSSWLEGMYLAALKAASEMASFLGDSGKSSEYAELFQKGYKYTRENLFNGRYFIQKCDITDRSILEKYDAVADYWNEETGQIKYQICDGSIIDQLLAVWHADIIGLGDIFDREQTDIALCEMMKNNFKSTMRGFTNPWRVFSTNDEAGTIMCDYPEGTEKPKIPIPYCEETMTGFEYALAGLLMSKGKTEEGLKIVKAVRDRYDGKKRNPWNEIECGSNYARSMASYALIPILSGFEFDMPHGHIGFRPYTSDKFRTIWSLDGVWGEFEKDGKCVRIKILGGSVKLKSIGLGFCENISSLKIDGKTLDFTFKDGKICFDETSISEYVEIGI